MGYGVTVVHVALGFVLLASSSQLAAVHQVPNIFAAVPQPAQGFDWWGAATFVGGLSSLVLAIGTTWAKISKANHGHYDDTTEGPGLGNRPAPPKTA